MCGMQMKSTYTQQASAVIFGLKLAPRRPFSYLTFLSGNMQMAVLSALAWYALFADTVRAYLCLFV